MELYALILKQKGADINTTISKNTNVIILGIDPGPSKMIKIEHLLADGYNITIIDEQSISNYLN